jgi:hypothetical protein
VNRDSAVSKTISLPISVWDYVDDRAHELKLRRSQYILNLIENDLSEQPPESLGVKQDTEPDDKQDNEQTPSNNGFDNILSSLNDI